MPTNSPRRRSGHRHSIRAALTVALATSNSFIIPTHQVNALIKGPGGYRVPDFMRAGGLMSILFIVVMLVMMNLVF